MSCKGAVPSHISFDGVAMKSRTGKGFLASLGKNVVMWVL